MIITVIIITTVIWIGLLVVTLDPYVLLLHLDPLLSLLSSVIGLFAGKT